MLAWLPGEVEAKKLYFTGEGRSLKQDIDTLQSQLIQDLQNGNEDDAARIIALVGFLVHGLAPCT